MPLKTPTGRRPVVGLSLLFPRAVCPVHAEPVQVRQWLSHRYLVPCWERDHHSSDTRGANWPGNRLEAMNTSCCETSKTYFLHVYGANGGDRDAERVSDCGGGPGRHPKGRAFRWSGGVARRFLASEGLGLLTSGSPHRIKPGLLGWGGSGVPETSLEALDVCPASNSRHPDRLAQGP